MVALTLPDEVVKRLRRIHPDLAWAVVTLADDRRRPGARRVSAPQADAELVTIARRHSLIVVNAAVFKKLPGISIVPMDGARAFLALEPGRGMADLELAVIDRLATSSSARERQALRSLRALLRRWRRNRALRFHTRAIIVVERSPARRAR